ncbi:hypothetical protein SERLA73DRAFT_174756 [Serpula lacrymans var. lacrymans S7.3]|uniref:Uncharacterized protein n=2 Tax=Serpula lacrymans var. lacrymans TaxID=341189 RepID=F8PKI0_SERL3|nr:uncharacterized protein SERLADRAFT_456404 [Serpula lacrymans var. lacrymans S7.9]EGO03314.1 hypothetical protein SERLA73DRAFT_174756 [Serpula lacrymans var. lacrymans S7.3]EGO29088.1 hypothetical protein SERLADRAFT_456404 [Serpula lacrymans var. lacrymans S7.9]
MLRSAPLPEATPHFHEHLQDPALQQYWAQLSNHPYPLPPLHQQGGISSGFPYDSFSFPAQQAVDTGNSTHQRDAYNTPPGFSSSLVHPVDHSQPVYSMHQEFTLQTHPYPAGYPPSLPVSTGTHLSGQPDLGDVSVPDPAFGRLSNFGSREYFEYPLDITSDSHMSSSNSVILRSMGEDRGPVSQLSPIREISLRSQFPPVDGFQSSPRGAPSQRPSPVIFSLGNEYPPYSHPTPVASVASDSHLNAGPLSVNPALSGSSSGTANRPSSSSPTTKRAPDPDILDVQAQTGRRVIPRYEGSSDAGTSYNMTAVPSSAGFIGPTVPRMPYSSRVFSTTSGAQGPIRFYFADPRENGIPLRADFTRRADKMEGHEVHVLNDASSSITLRIDWPGYDAWSRQVRSKNWRKKPGPLTRVELARRVASAVQEFIEEKQDEPVPAAHARWKVGPDGIRDTDLVLVALHQVSKGSWQPEVRLNRPLGLR